MTRAAPALILFLAGACCALAQSGQPETPGTAAQLLAQIQSSSDERSPVPRPTPALPAQVSGQMTGQEGAESQPVAGEAAPYMVLVLDFDQAYASSAWGRHAQEQAEAAAQEIYAENTRLEEELTADEQALKAERDSLSAAEFRRRAEAFDARAQTIRRERAEVLRDFEARSQVNRNAFIQATLPAAASIMQERNAAVVLDRQQTLLAANSVDITEELVARLDETVGQGPGFPEMVPDQPDAPAAEAPDTDAETENSTQDATETDPAATGAETQAPSQAP